LLLATAIILLAGCGIPEPETAPDATVAADDAQVPVAVNTEPAEEPKAAPEAESTTTEVTAPEAVIEKGPIEISAGDFQAKVIDAGKPALVDFWAPWCGPCRMLEPVLDNLGEQFAGQAVIARLNIDHSENQELAQKYQVRAIPYVAIFENGEIVKDWVGFGPDIEQEIAAALKKAIAD